MDELRKKIIGEAQGAMALNLAFIGIVNHLFETLARLGRASVEELAGAARVDAGYLARWCEAAYAFGYLEEQAGRYALTERGQAFRPDARDTLMPFAVQAVLGAHMAERAAGLMPNGERPGEQVLAERATVLPWFGPMLEATFGGLFEREILPQVPAYGEIDRRRGVAVDLGCGNGWYLRRLAARFPHLTGIGLDGFEENVRQAERLAQASGVAARLKFQAGDIYHYTVSEPVDLVAMNRALHHVWDAREKVFTILRDSLSPGGVAIIWEPNWPTDVHALQDPQRRGMAFQNLSEHVQGNHFLRPPEIEAAFASVGMQAETYLFANGNEAVVVGRRG